MREELLILRSLLFEDSFTRRVLPFIKSEYFLDRQERILFEVIKGYIDKYNVLPPAEAVALTIEHTGGLSQDEVEEIQKSLDSLVKAKAEVNEQWLTDTAEKWCQEKALHNAMLEAIDIIEDKAKKHKTGMIPTILQNALAVCFDASVGHDYFENADDRFEFYHKVEQRLPFHLEYFNLITKNGVPRKTLNICLAGTGVGKSLFMCDLAASYLLKDKNVLYITMEMAEERIAERIDANLMDLELDKLQFVTKEGFDRRIDRINGKTKGKLIIKEYATGAAHVGHFRQLLQELALKKNFKPDAIFIDYLNICASSRIKMGSAGSYELVKSIAEELRGLAVEFDVPVWSATQMNRAGFNNTDPDLTNTSESFGLPATADFMFALVRDDEFNVMNQLLVKILKNRYGGLDVKHKGTGKIISRFFVGVDYTKMKLYDVDPSAQDNLNNGPVSSTPDSPAQVASLPDSDDVPPMPPSDADAAAERRRISAAHGSAPYKPGYSQSLYRNRNKVVG